MKKLLARDISPRAALAVIALALAATVVSGREKPDLAEPADTPARAAARAAAPEAAPELDPARLKRTRTDQAIADLFASPPPAEAQGGQSAPRTSAPPLPFQYVAKIIDGGATHVYVMLGEDHYSVKPGLVIDRNYKVEKITETAITFTYLPLGTRQVLSLN
jgi:hypothetical protein